LLTLLRLVVRQLDGKVLLAFKQLPRPDTEPHDTCYGSRHWNIEHP
jgi:hypothetical protein